MGTTGEAPTLSLSEKYDILDFADEYVAGRVPIVAGFGGNNTAKIIAAINGYKGKAIAVLSSSPAYNKPSQKGLYAHYMRIAENTDYPIIIYNVPARTGSNIEADTTLKLAEQSTKFIAIKEASNRIAQCMKLSKLRRDGFLLISGDDLHTLPLISMGFDGAISVIANALPKQFSAMVYAALDNNFAMARTHHFELLEIMRLI